MTTGRECNIMVDGKPLTDWMPLAKGEARKALAWCGDLFTIDELVSIASLALVKAASKYKPGKCTFGVYCRQRIRWNFKNAKKRTLFVSAGRNPKPRLLMLTGLMDTIADKRGLGPTVNVANGEFLDFIEASLPQRWFRVVKLHGIEGYTFDAVGKLLDTSRQNAFRIYKKSLRVLYRKIVFGRKEFLCPA